jgi:hypothetical protein
MTNGRTTKPEGKRGQARATFREVINEATTKDKVRELVEQALSLNGLVYGHCTECGRRVQVEVPGVKKRIDALVALLERAEGKPTGDWPASRSSFVASPCGTPMKASPTSFGRLRPPPAEKATPGDPPKRDRESVPVRGRRITLGFWNLGFGVGCRAWIGARGSCGTGALAAVLL